MCFRSFSWGTRGRFITFSVSNMDMLRFIFYNEDYWNWLTTDILQLFPVMQISSLQELALCSKDSHLPLSPPEASPRSSMATGPRPWHKTIWKMTFYRDHLQLWEWVSADSARVNRPPCPNVLPGVCTTIQIVFFLSFSTPTLPAVISSRHNAFPSSNTKEEKLQHKQQRLQPQSGVLSL